jgi:hypothetical protein
VTLTRILVGVALLTFLAVGLVVGWLVGVQRPSEQPHLASGQPGSSKGGPASSSGSWIRYFPEESKPLQSVNVDRWTFRYAGGPIDCWLDVEESGQQTMNKLAFIGKGGAWPISVPAQGTFAFIIRHSPRRPLNLRGGSELVGAKEGVLGFALDDVGGHSNITEGLWFGWDKVAHSSWTALAEEEKGVALTEGDDVTLLTYEAQDRLDDGAGEPGRKVRLTLKARLSAKD